MKEVLVVRDRSSDAGTPGKLTAPAGFECYTLEPPWIDADANGKRDPGVSCIKPWSGVVRMTKSPSRKNLDGSAEVSYELQGVPDAAGVRIHHGNFAGDKSKGLLSDSEACLLLGRALMDVEIPQKRQPLLHRPACHHGKADHVDQGGTLSCRCICTCPRRTKQYGITSSRDAVAAFVAHMGRDPFKLTIKWAPGAAPQEAV